MGQSSIDGVMVGSGSTQARSEECLCSGVSFNCLLNRIYSQVWLAYFFCTRGLTRAALLLGYYRFPWNFLIGPGMLRDHLLPPLSLFLSFHHWKKKDHGQRKGKYGEPFTVLSQKHRPMQTRIRGKSHSGSPLSSALISSGEQCGLTLQPELYFGKSVPIKAWIHERRACSTDQPVTHRFGDFDLLQMEWMHLRDRHFFFTGE